MTAINSNPNAHVAVTPSKFAMWRTAVSLAFADGHLSNSETALVHEWWGRFDFTPEQIAQLEKDFTNGVSFDEVWPAITDKLDRAHLIYFALILFHIDAEYSAAEEALFQKMNDLQMATIDYKQAWRDANKSAKEFIDSEALKRAKENETKNPFLKATYYLVENAMDQDVSEDKTIW